MNNQKKDTLIIYNSIYGTSQIYAKYISEEFCSDVLEYNKNISLDEISSYNKIIFISALYAGKLSNIKSFKKIFNKIKDKNIYYILVGLTDTSNIEYYNNAISKNFNDYEKTSIKFYFLRGAINFDKLNFKHRFMMNMLKIFLMLKIKKTESEKLLIKTFGENKNFIDRNNISNIISTL